MNNPKSIQKEQYIVEFLVCKIYLYTMQFLVYNSIWEGLNILHLSDMSVTSLWQTWSNRQTGQTATATWQDLCIDQYYNKGLYRQHPLSPDSLVYYASHNKECDLKKNFSLLILIMTWRGIIIAFISTRWQCCVKRFILKASNQHIKWKWLLMHVLDWIFALTSIWSV